MKVESPGPSSPQTEVTAGSAYNPSAFLTSFSYDDTCDLTQDLTLMPQYFAESPASSLSTPTTQTSFEDFHSSSSSSSASTVYTPASLLADKAFYVDSFSTHDGTYFDGSYLQPAFTQVKQESSLYLDTFESTFESFADQSYNTPFQYARPEPIHPSIEMPASPLPDPQPFSGFQAPTFTAAFPALPSLHASFDQNVDPAPTFNPTTATSTYNINGYTSSSSDETILETPVQTVVPQAKKAARNPKTDKDIKCDHCGIDKTPLWRKVPDKENSYHCNACGLYYKSNGCFRSVEGDGRVIRHSKKSRKSGDAMTLPLRSGPVTANRNLTCANCETNNTVLWRKGPDGQSPLCNPCGLFYKLHGSHRSPEKRKEIHRRNRVGKKRFSITSWTSEDGEDEGDSPVEFTFRQEYVKRESPSTAEWTQAQYQYNWHAASVPGRC